MPWRRQVGGGGGRRAGGGAFPAAGRCALTWRGARCTAHPPRPAPRRCAAGALTAGLLGGQLAPALPFLDKLQLPEYVTVADTWSLHARACCRLRVLDLQGCAQASATALCFGWGHPWALEVAWLAPG